MSLDEASGEEDASKQPRTSVRVQNKQQLLQNKIQECVPSSPLCVEDPSSESSKKRTWEQWWSEDERSFYEALSDCGKNFESMREFFVKQKKTNKTKGQIRTFYYRTWHKINRSIAFPEGLSKSTKELYGLINYGELRKRLGGKLDEKNSIKLQELVLNGSTTLRVKGKTVRLKTPMCPALKRLSNRRSSAFPLHKDASESEGSEAVLKRLPRNIQLLLSPRCSSDFIRVHGQALQNPKLSLGTDLQRTVGSVVKYLENKWRTQTASERRERLTLLPKEGVSLKTPIFFPVEPLTSEDLSLGRVSQGERVVEEEVVVQEEPSPWNAECSLSVGEMYLMLGGVEETEVELTYSFQKGDEEKPFEKDDRYRTLNTLIKLVNEKLKKTSSSKAAPLSPLKSEEDPTFRRPAVPTPAAAAFKQQLDLLLPKYNNRKGRPMSRKSASSRGPSRPKFILPSSEVKLRLLPQVTVTHPLISIQEPLSLQVISSSPLHNDEHEAPLSPSESLNSLKSTDRFLDSVLGNSSLLQTPPLHRSPPSPFVPEGGSLSSWSFPSSPFPERARSIIEEDSSHSTNSEVDRQLLSMMTESSVDFTSKFAKLASHITSDV